ncbi:membrane-associated guanylate kinase, WW and PDZ domain-containing protein 1 isoform X2 [Chrysoperla carnea]|uniref:membrane-associated guanylate kinase, WW and PDZ domain-containing protein 1 isoform X2 n=1 Tax=Chrysoperla carnea TaxID=189513 RepID=UPI001D0634BB|nr:membrane-associated guanylate kinase, WW and PDZ domain-containing protein 1 isoform X2 [Chrysoperla carnea]
MSSSVPAGPTNNGLGGGLCTLVEEDIIGVGVVNNDADKQSTTSGGRPDLDLQQYDGRSSMDIECRNYRDYDIDGDLGPLPPKWEKAYTENGEVYFIDHSTGTSHWLDPRLSKFQKKSLEDCLDDELPYGWEKITDPQYGTYFIDHVNRRTQYENPVLQAKQAVEQRLSTPNSGTKQGRASFTKDPSELCGERFTTTLTKSSRGLGFTIIGGDDDVDEFLQIKSIVPNGPAWLDGKLQTGDLIVYVNETCVLGFTHNQVVNLFQSISPGEAVCLEVCRGYPLPFDPNDPNTEVVTTVAVDSQATSCETTRNFVDFNFDRNLNFMNNSENDLWKYSNGANQDRLNDVRNICTDLANTVVIHIVKGAMGFGFTIADSACGQRVKKILDRQRCKNLFEGDVLLEINNINVQSKSHDEVVQVLKNCPHNEEAVIIVQRGQCVSSKLGKNKLRKIENGRLTTKDIVANMYRSKTPTADLYSTQQKEILPNRPKTPLVDTRNRSKTPLAEVSASSTSSCQSDVLNSNYNINTYGETPGSNIIAIANEGSTPVPPSEHQYYHYETCYCHDCKKTKINSNYCLSIPEDNEDMKERNLDRRKPDMSSTNDLENHYTVQQSVYQPWDHMTQRMQRLNVDSNEIVVTLIRQESGFGFRIVGGTEEGSQVAVGHIVPGGAADLDGRICTGDIILNVDGHSVINSSHHQVVQLMGIAAANGRVKLRIRRRRNQLPSSASTYNVVVTRSENEGFGFVIISSANKAGSTIGRLIEGSPAERCGLLQVGDCIVAVNHIPITNLCHGDIVNLIKDSGYSVVLTIGVPANDAN